MLQKIIQILKPIVIHFIKVRFKGIFSGVPSHEVKEDFKDRNFDQLRTSDTDIVILKDFLTPNKFSRPGVKRDSVNGLEIHWVANPNTSAKFNRNWFERLGEGKYGFASTQFIIDLDGDIIQMIPEDEIAYSSGMRGRSPGRDRLGSKQAYYYTLSIECTHSDWSGKMTPKTMSGLKKLVIHLCNKYGLTADDLYLHYDITGKICHKWFVDNPKEWSKFKNYINNNLDNKFVQ